MIIPKIIELVPPRISVDHIKEKIVCIRGHRERLFQVSTEIINNKLICHNYGQGGAGYTFLFGCVHESLRQFERQLAYNPHFKNKPILVIGAGCYGLLTAVMLACRGYSVSIIAKDIKNIASYKAAGFFFPRARKTSTSAEIAVFESLGLESYRTYLQIIAQEHSFIKSGASLLPAYYDPAIDPGFTPYIKNGLISAPEHVIIDFNNGKRYTSIKYTTLFIDSAALMHELNHAINSLNIKITQQEIQSFSSCEESIIFNCAGLGAKYLVPDARIIPIQGHLISLKDQPHAQQLNYMINVKVQMPSLKGFLRDELIYYAPKEAGILGITFMRGQDSLTANQHEFDRLLRRCQDFFGT